MPLALVTGGAGFIGSHLTRALVRRGWRVRVLDNLSTGRRDNLDDIDVDLRVGDICDRDLVASAVTGAARIYHLAAMISVPESLADPVACYQVNVIGSLNILRAAQQAGVPRVVLSSSCAVYGEARGAVDEDSPAAPLSPYAASKLAMEQVAQVMSQGPGLQAACLRYFNVYGPRQAPDSPYAAAIPIFVREMLRGQPPTVYGDGLQTRDFVYIDDVVEANLLAAEFTGAGGSLFNIASGHSVSVLDLIAVLRELLPSAAPPAFGEARPGDIRFSAANIARAESRLGFHPRTGLRTGLAETVEWLRDHPA